LEMVGRIGVPKISLKELRCFTDQFQPSVIQVIKKPRSAGK